MTAKLIGLVGYKGAGKTTTTGCAIYDPRLVMRPLPIFHMSFSTPIIDMLAALGIPRETLDNKKLWDTPQSILCGKTIRHAATTLGTEWGREQIAQQLWTNIALSNAEKIRSQGVSALIDNCRFPSEFDDLKASGAIMIAYHRAGLEPDLSHSSEQHIAELQERCDLDFNNNGTFEQGVHRLRLLLHSLTKPDAPRIVSPSD